MVVVLILGMVNITYGANGIDYYEQNYPGYEEYVRAMHEAIDSRYIDFYRGDSISKNDIDPYVASEMIMQIYHYCSSETNEAKEQQLVAKYCDENIPMMAAEEEKVNEALKYRYSMSLDELMKIANQDYEDVFIREGYVFCSQPMRGVAYPDAVLIIDELTELNENMKYAVWHLKDEYTGEEYQKYYSVMESNLVNGRKIVKYHYLSYDKPSNQYIASFSAQGAKEHGISVNINGEKITFDQPPEIINDRTMVPVRAIFEKLGAKVEWNAATRTVIGTRGCIIFSIAIGENCAYKNGMKIYLDSPAAIVNDRTLVPVRAVSEAFGCDVGWNGDTRTVSIQEKEKMNQADILKKVSVDFDKDGVKETVSFVGGKSWKEAGYGQIYSCDIYFGDTLMKSDVSVLADTIDTVNHNRCTHLYFQTYATVQRPTYVMGMENGIPHFYFYGDIEGKFNANNIFNGTITYILPDGGGRKWDSYDYEWNGMGYAQINNMSDDAWFEAYKNYYNANIKDKPTGLSVETGSVAPSELESIDMINLDNDDTTYPDMILTYCHDDTSVSKIFSIDNNLNVRETTVTDDDFGDTAYYFMQADGKNYYVNAAIPAAMVVLYISEYTDGKFKTLYSIELYDNVEHQTPYSGGYIWVNDEYCYSYVVYDVDKNVITDTDFAKELYKKAIGKRYNFSYITEFNKDIVVKYEPDGEMESLTSKKFYSAGCGNEGNFPNRADIFSGYSEIIRNSKNADTSYKAQYSLYDIDMDGILELIVDDEMPHSISKIKVYKFTDRVVYMGDIVAPRSELCNNPNGPGIIGYNAFKNRQWLDLWTYNGTEFDLEVLTEFKEIYDVDEQDPPWEIMPGVYYLETCSVDSDELLKRCL